MQNQQALQCLQRTQIARSLRIAPVLFRQTRHLAKQSPHNRRHPPSDRPTSAPEVIHNIGTLALRQETQTVPNRVEFSLHPTASLQESPGILVDRFHIY